MILLDGSVAGDRGYRGCRLLDAVRRYRPLIGPFLDCFAESASKGLNVSCIFVSEQ
jgi:hypothetical protein